MSIPTESLPRVSTEHIAIDERGQAKLAGHRIKVKHIVALKQAHGYTAEQLQSEAYPHLGLNQIYAALSYYHDHQAEIDRQIRDDDEEHQRQLETQRRDPEFQARVARMKARDAAQKNGPS
jgi:uncharacterized protein (DUF433 family)